MFPWGLRIGAFFKALLGEPKLPEVLVAEYSGCRVWGVGFRL